MTMTHTFQQGDWDGPDAVLRDYRYTGTATAGIGYRVDVWQKDGGARAVWYQDGETQTIVECESWADAEAWRQRFASEGLRKYWHTWH